MDPNALLNEILDDARKLADFDGGEYLEHYAKADVDFIVFAQKIVELDEWLVRGGFRPNRWVNRGVDLTMGDVETRMHEEIQRVRDLMSGKHLVLPAKNPQLVIGQNVLDPQGDMFHAGLSVVTAFDGDPVQAISNLHDALKEQMEKAAQA